MRTFLSVLIAATLLLHAPAPAPAAESGGYSALTESRTPLVILRFSQRNLYYEHALYNAVSKAIETKHDVTFDVVLRPGNGSTANSPTQQKVLDSLRRMGVPPPQIRAATGPGSGQRYDEVHIFVR